MWFYSLLSAFCEVGKTIAGIPFTDGDAAAAVQSLSCVWLFSTPWTAAHQASLSFTISQSLLVIMSIESVMPSNHLILSHPLLLPSIFPTIRVFSNESAFCPRWPNMCVCVCVCVYVYTTYLIYLFISWWHSGCFYILTMVNSAVMEHVHLRCMYLIWNSVFIFFSYIPKSGIQIYTLE